VESLRRVRIWSQQAHGGSLTRCSSGLFVGEMSKTDGRS
jgi:hypothetical protein